MQKNPKACSHVNGEKEILWCNIVTSVFTSLEFFPQL
jgi:hypothetical protein